MLIAKNISKGFGSVTVLRDINLIIERGQVMAIIGENGAGKSTLMKIFSGVYSEYSGKIEIDGKEVKFNSTKDAEGAGISIIHQELNLVPEMSILDNIFLGCEIKNRFGMLDNKKMFTQAEELLQKLHLDYSPNTLVRNLKVGEQQLVEIAKALLTESSLIIMDEPTSAISGAEVELLFNIIRELKNENKAILYISHKLDELYTIADKYAVLRDGQLISQGEMKGITKSEIIEYMAGRKIDLSDKQESYAREDIALECKDWTYSHPNFSFLNKLHFKIKIGEIVGIFGLMGSGRTELLQSIFGLRKYSGTIQIEGKDHDINSPSKAIEKGIALLSEDRKKEGIFPIMSVVENLNMSALVSDKDQWRVQPAIEKANLTHFTEQLSIKFQDGSQKIEQLSGGNQQKVILARCLLTKPKILLLDEPTRGVDVKAKEEIYAVIRQLAQQGTSILFVSSEMVEIMSLSNRILVMAEGQITGDLDASKTTEQEILKHALNLN
jgi:ribose transport system ATP-binding protein